MQHLAYITFQLVWQRVQLEAVHDGRLAAPDAVAMRSSDGCRDRPLTVSPATWKESTWLPVDRSNTCTRGSSSSRA